MPGHRELGHQLGTVCRLEGEFTLRSGKLSTTYFDKYLFESDPRLLGEIATHAAKLIPEGIEILAGLELGGVPVATAVSMATGLPAVFVRKQAKAYGTAKLAEGVDIDNRRVLIVEDVITTGGQVAMSATDLRARGAIVHSALCVIDRSQGDHPELDQIGCSLISLFTSDELA